MPTNKEFAVLMDDRPGTLGRICRTLADRNINILGFQSFPIGGRSVVRFVFDNAANAKSELEKARLTFTESDVAEVKLPHRPGEIARVASRLGDAGININYAYCGLEAGSNTPLVFFGVHEVAKAVPILDKEAAAAAKG